MPVCYDETKTAPESRERKLAMQSTLARLKSLAQWRYQQSQACLGVALVDVLLRTVGAPKTISLLKISMLELPSSRIPAPPPRRLRLTVAAVDSVYRRLPVPDSCLRRAIVCSVLLGVRQTSVVVGVGRGSVGIQAHAWIDTASGAVDVGPWSEPSQQRVASRRLRRVRSNSKGQVL